ncbi:MAG: DUF5682 family protein [Planctomycetales bacterium]
MAIHVFGIRHHGPGCARSLRKALDELRPDAIVMEGPADAQETLALAADADMRPPVAMLLYPSDEPRRAAYYPLAQFSPEWQTLQWGAGHQIPVRLMDLPQSHQFALERMEEVALRPQDSAAPASADALPDDPESTELSTASDPPPEEVADDAPNDSAPDGAADSAPDSGDWRTDPLALLAEAAGYKDHELWWEEQIERRHDATGLFAAILEAMRTVREEFPETRARDLLREAHMRRTIREVVREGFERVAVVCGAWHAPLVDEEAVAGRRAGCRVADDQARLKGLPRVKTTVTWIPWTSARLSTRSGYGAGVESPGWYGHLWSSNDQAPTRWLATAARLLRENDLDASSAGVLEALRLADALAALRELRSPGLSELNEAILTVLCHGEPAPMHLIRRKLEIGDEWGAVPASTPAVPLALDLARLQSGLKMKPSSESRPLSLDLRKENDLARSQLLHRLALLEIPWGVHQRSGGKLSTFHELWQLEWKPEFAVAIIEANVWGNSVQEAATAKVTATAVSHPELAHVTALLDCAILAGLEEAVGPILVRINTMAAVGADVRHLMEALPPLARVARYGDVRGTQSQQVEPIVVGILERVLVGLGAACSALDEEAATRMLDSLGHVSEALDLLQRDDLLAGWLAALRNLMEGSVHPLLRGACCRRLLERQALEADELHRQARLALCSANPPLQCADWAAGLMRGSGLVLLHQDTLWTIFNIWLVELAPETFVELLPLLRRAFADFTGHERRQMGEKVKRLGEGPIGTPRRHSAALPQIDPQRAARILPVLAHIFGVPLAAKRDEAGAGSITSSGASP